MSDFSTKSRFLYALANARSYSFLAKTMRSKVYTKLSLASLREARLLYTKLKAEQVHITHEGDETIEFIINFAA